VTLTFGSLFAGIGGLDSHAHNFCILLDSAEFIRGQYANVCYAMAVGTQNNPILDGIASALAFGDDVMGITARLLPAASHTDIRIEAAHGSIPATFIGIFFLAGMDVGFAFVPRDSWANPRERGNGCIALLLCLSSVLMPNDVSEFSTPPIISRAPLSAPTCT